MRAWVTKYALTEGIKEVEAEPSSIDDRMICVRAGSTGFNQYFHGKDWHLSIEAAVVRAEEMRLAKVRAVEKQSKKLQAMKFEEVK